MSHYDEICAVCPTKRFITPGGSKGNGPRHDGPWGPDDAAIAAALDADHVAVPISIDGREAQEKLLALLVNKVRAAVPSAARLELETSDQSYGYGFALRDLCDASGNSVIDRSKREILSEEAADELGDLNWDSVVGEDDYGYAIIDLTRSA